MKTHAYARQLLKREKERHMMQVQDLNPASKLEVANMVQGMGALYEAIKSYNEIMMQDDKEVEYPFKFGTHTIEVIK